MGLQYNGDILAKLKEAGYNSNRLRQEKIIGQSFLQQIRHGEIVSWKKIELLCKLMKCQPGDILIYKDDDPEE